MPNLEELAPPVASKEATPASRKLTVREEARERPARVQEGADQPAADAKPANEKLLAFLKRRGGEVDFSSFTPEKVAHLTETFALVPAIAREISVFTRDRFRLEAGVTLGNRVEQSITDFLEDLVLTDPDAVLRYREAIVVFKAAPTQIAEREKEIDDALKGLPGYELLTERRAALAQERATIEKKQKRAARPIKAFERSQPKNKILGYFFNLGKRLFDSSEPAGAASGTVARTEEEPQLQARLAEIESEVAEVDKNIATYDQADALKATLHQSFEGYRRSLFDAIVPLQELTERASDMVEQRLMGLLHEGTLESLQSAQAYLEQVRTQPDSLDFMQHLDSEKFQEELDYLIAAAANTELDKKLDAVHEYADLEKAVEPYMKLEKLGSKNAERTRKFFANVLRAKIENEPDEAKRLLLKRIVAKHGLFEKKVTFIRGKKNEGIWQTA